MLRRTITRTTFFTEHQFLLFSIALWSFSCQENFYYFHAFLLATSSSELPASGCIPIPQYLKKRHRKEEIFLTKVETDRALQSYYEVQDLMGYCSYLQFFGVQMIRNVSLYLSFRSTYYTKQRAVPCLFLISSDEYDGMDVNLQWVILLLLLKLELFKPIARFKASLWSCRGGWSVIMYTSIWNLPNFVSISYW